MRTNKIINISTLFQTNYNRDITNPIKLKIIYIVIYSLTMSLLLIIITMKKNESINKYFIRTVIISLIFNLTYRKEEQEEEEVTTRRIR